MWSKSPTRACLEERVVLVLCDGVRAVRWGGGYAYSIEWPLRIIGVIALPLRVCLYVSCAAPRKSSLALSSETLEGKGGMLRRSSWISKREFPSLEQSVFCLFRLSSSSLCRLGNFSRRR